MVIPRKKFHHRYREIHFQNFAYIRIFTLLGVLSKALKLKYAYTYNLQFGTHII